MASKIDFVEYVCGQISGAGEVSYKKMFGEYGLYLDGKFVGGICDNQFFIKITDSGRGILTNPIEKPMYEGGSNSFLIDDLEDSDLLVRLLRATWTEVPFPKSKEKDKKRKLKTIIHNERLMIMNAD